MISHLLTLMSFFAALQGTGNNVTFSQVSSETFLRDQPRLKRLIRWGSETLVETEISGLSRLQSRNQNGSEYFQLDLKAEKVIPFVSPLSGKLLRLDRSSNGRKGILFKSGPTFSVAVEEKGKWKSHHLDFEFLETEPFLFAMGESSIALILKTQAFIERSGKWIRVDIKGSAPKIEGAWNPETEELCRADHWLLFDDEILLAYGRGEFEGGIVSLDLNHGNWKALPKPDSRETINELQLGPDGFIWASAGVAHLGFDSGSLRVLSRNSPESFLGEEKLGLGKILSTLPGTSIESLDWDEKSTPYILTGAAGILRYSATRGWERITPAWSYYQYVNSLLVMPKGDAALIGTNNAGLLLWNFDGGRVRRFTFNR